MKKDGDTMIKKSNVFKNMFRTKDKSDYKCYYPKERVIDTKSEIKPRKLQFGLVYSMLDFDKRMYLFRDMAERHPDITPDQILEEYVSSDYLIEKLGKTETRRLVFRLDLWNNTDIKNKDTGGVLGTISSELARDLAYYGLKK